MGDLPSISSPLTSLMGYTSKGTPITVFFILALAIAELGLVTHLIKYVHDISPRHY